MSQSVGGGFLHAKYRASGLGNDHRLLRGRAIRYCESACKHISCEKLDSHTVQLLKSSRRAYNSRNSSSLSPLQCESPKLTKSVESCNLLVSSDPSSSFKLGKEERRVVWCEISFFQRLGTIKFSGFCSQKNRLCYQQGQ